MEGPTSPNNAADDMGSLDRMDSLDDYFLLHSPPESPQQRQREIVTQGGSSQAAQQQRQQEQQGQPLTHPLDLPFGYYFGNNEFASQGNVQCSTLNFTVDRSNAVSSDQDGSSSAMVFGRLLPGTQKDIEELLKLEEKDVSLSELFLQSRHRSSLNSTYQAKGALMGHDNELYRPRCNSLSSSFLEDVSQKTNANTNTNTNHGGTSSNQQAQNNGRNPDQQQSLDFDLEVDVEPTPLSEIKAKSQLRNYSSSDTPLTSRLLEHHEYQQNKQDHRMHHGSNYYPFGRAYQLPIPTMLPDSPLQPDQIDQQALDDAVATAAALASAQHPEHSTTINQSHSPIYPHPEQALPHSPQGSHAASHSSWHHSDRSETRNSSIDHGSYHPGQSHSHHASHSTSDDAQTSQDPLLYTQHQHSHHPHPHQPQPRPPYHQRHQPISSSQPSYSQQPHHRDLTTPLASGGRHHLGHTIIGPYTTAQREGSVDSGIPDLLRRAAAKSSPKVTSAPAPATSYLPRRGDHTQREASAAHTAPKGLLAEAATQRRGYTGYNVPATGKNSTAYHHAQFPSYTGESSSSSFAKKPASTSEAAEGNSSNPSPSPMEETSKPNIDGASAVAAAEAHAHADNAYERKKQRAKDARVKLNESIDRLHVSMGVAGTESKKRAEQLRNFMKQAGKEDQSHTDHQAFELMESCVKTAESAKKWDRPNFVGSAATMIQCLNSQCETLMKELLECQEAAMLQPKRPGAQSQLPVPVQDSAATVMNGESEGGKQQNQGRVDTPPGKRHLDKSFDDKAGEYPAEKRRHLTTSVDEEKKEASSATNVGGNPVSPESGVLPIYYAPDGHTYRLGDSIMDLIAAFLDPGSLIQCTRVCKTWNRGHCFARLELWESLCIKRFGISNLRQWREKHSDDEGDELALMEDNCQSGDSKLEQSTGMKIYREMDERCIMPWLQQDGRSHLLLGKTQIPTAAVAAWLYLVERSNGETMRSVRKPQPTFPPSRNTGLYTSLPVVELRIVLQNTGGCIARKSTPPNKRDASIVIKDQRLVVDASTRRRGEELLEIDWDDRFSKRLLHADGSEYVPDANQPRDVLCTLKLFETVVVVASVHARRCSTSSKFIQRSNFLKLLLSVRGTTQPLIIPIQKEGAEKHETTTARET